MSRIELVEVSPRDGLQNEPRVLPTEDKIELVRRAIDAGARRLEVASFVHPAKVPQMADAEAVVAGLPRGAARYVGLVLNKRGALRALETEIHEIGVVCTASDAFGMRNQGMDSAQSLDMACDVLRFCHEHGRPAQVTIAVAFGCPFEGAIDPTRVVAMARRIAAAGSIEVAIADTIGIARPGEVERLSAQIAAAVAPLPLRVHFHDTHGMGVANVMAAVRAGASTVDASIGGTGGCPFAPGAAGNVASENVAYALSDAMDADLTKLVDTAAWLNTRLGRDTTSAVARAFASG
ncbi:hydroxymethylglutaryl-CoA lyase [Sphingomonas sp. M1-B02]|uniref:hydroxymethylglutaryl-CoA lyase n=1 Tax=Sphingomonas sp. M1-B02 TaxID=3114300 RepID=UPI00224074CD|nr:hydroxymethylglutaryl-CoA lyase [Sphingomonas sp. S6-11]UZK67278.1 hydroxymethylglutaryl-CoA lyase [Sphingomonas sp. S6-11]